MTVTVTQIAGEEKCWAGSGALPLSAEWSNAIEGGSQRDQQLQPPSHRPSLDFMCLWGGSITNIEKPTIDRDQPVCRGWGKRTFSSRALYHASAGFWRGQWHTRRPIRTLTPAQFSFTTAQTHEEIHHGMERCCASSLSGTATSGAIVNFIAGGLQARLFDRECSK